MELKAGYCITLTLKVSESYSLEFIANRVGYHDRVEHTLLGCVLRPLMEDKTTVYTSAKFIKPRIQNEYPQLTDKEKEVIDNLIINVITNLAPGSVPNVSAEATKIEQAIFNHFNKE